MHYYIVQVLQTFQISSSTPDIRGIPFLWSFVWRFIDLPANVGSSGNYERPEMTFHFIIKCEKQKVDKRSSV